MVYGFKCNDLETEMTNSTFPTSDDNAISDGNHASLHKSDDESQVSPANDQIITIESESD